MKYDIVIFDLDGTLLNTIGDLAASVDYVMRSRNLPEHTDAEYRQMVGGGIKRLVERALPSALAADENYVDDCVTQFRRYYVDNIDRHTYPYEGMPELLRELRRCGVKLAVASNKFHAGTKKLIDKFFGDFSWKAIYGNREGFPLKPDPAIVDLIVEQCGATKENTYFIGDSGIDMKTANDAGVHSVGVTWGFREREELTENGAEYIVDTPKDILKIVL